MLDRQVFISFPGSPIDSGLGHLKLLLCIGNIVCYTYTTEYPPSALLGRQGMYAETIVLLTSYLP